MNAPPPEFLPDEPLQSVTFDRACIRCSYNLRGLPVSGVCPECGTPVEESLRGYYLAFAAPEYVRALHRGLNLILNGILVGLVAVFGRFTLGLWLPSTLSPPLRFVIEWLMLLAPCALVLAGYWLLTSPDPGVVTRESPTSPRRVVRITVVVAGAAVAALAIADLASAGATRAARRAAEALSLAGGLAAFAACVAGFFTSMMYLGWLGRRVPDRIIVARSGSFAWMLPLIAVVLAPFLLAGPIIALGLYWALLDRLRRQLRSIRQTGNPARLG